MEAEGFLKTKNERCNERATRGLLFRRGAGAQLLAEQRDLFAQGA